jgi:hypothetical protein
MVPWVPLKGKPLMEGLLMILRDQYSRAHDQDHFFDGVVYVDRDLMGVIDERTRCGTTGCIAGWGAVLSAPLGAQVVRDYVTLDGGEGWYVADWTEAALGVPGPIARVLFYYTNNEQAIRALELLLKKDYPGTHDGAHEFSRDIGLH